MSGKGMNNKGGGFGPVPPGNRSGGGDDKSGKGPGKGGSGPNSGAGPGGRGGKSGGMRRSQGK